MDTHTLQKGLFIGLAIAAPVGPIGILVIQRSLGDALIGLVTGLAAAVADALYAFATANPATILSFAAVSATQGLARAAHAAAFATGVFFGSAAWSLLLSTGLRFGSKRLTPRAFRVIHRSSAGALLLFAALAIVKGARDFP